MLPLTLSNCHLYNFAFVRSFCGPPYFASLPFIFRKNSFLLHKKEKIIHRSQKKTKTNKQTIKKKLKKNEKENKMKKHKKAVPFLVEIL